MGSFFRGFFESMPWPIALGIQLCGLFIAIAFAVRSANWPTTKSFWRQLRKLAKSVGASFVEATRSPLMPPPTQRSLKLGCWTDIDIGLGCGYTLLFLSIMVLLTSLPLSTRTVTVVNQFAAIVTVGALFMVALIMRAQAHKAIVRLRELRKAESDQG